MRKMSHYHFRRMIRVRDVLPQAVAVFGWDFTDPEDGFDMKIRPTGEFDYFARPDHEMPWEYEFEGENFKHDDDPRWFYVPRM